LCVVGTGPVGMALALEFEELGREVLVLESGDMEVDAEIADASRAAIADERRHAKMELAVCRALGGTSWTWGGRCVPFDDVDLLDRSFVPEGHWPLTHNEIRPWYRTASKYMFCGGDQFEIPYERKLTGGLTLDALERWATQSRLILPLRDRLLGSKLVKIALKSTLVGLNLSSEGNEVESLEVSTPEGRVQVKASRFILAAGGVESTRILLHCQRQWPQHFGGAQGALGRYYMGHISGKIASIQFDRPKDFADLDFKLDDNGSYYRRRFMLTTEAQVENKVLNTAFWPDNPPFYDPGHRSGVLSSVFLALAFPPTGRRLLSEAIRLAHTGPRPYKLGQHLRNAILGAPRAALDIYRILRDRFLRKPAKPGFLVPNKGGEYALHYHAEQIPLRDSTVGLSGELDAFGLPRATIDLRFTEQDVESVIRSHELLDQALRANGMGRLKFLYTPEKMRERVWEQASDGFHQVGTARMGRDASRSVVDPDLKVHGLTNLYVASSAVFPTTGQANSTMLAVALAMKLAHHLAAPAAAAALPGR